MELARGAAPPMAPGDHLTTRTADLEQLKRLYAELENCRRAKVGTLHPRPLARPRARHRRLLICSHRVPFIIEHSAAGWRLNERIDPTVNMYKTVIALLRGNPDSILIGVPPMGGDPVPSHVFRWLRTEMLHEHRYLPVQSADRQRQVFFMMYCKTKLWCV